MDNYEDSEDERTRARLYVKEGKALQALLAHGMVLDDALDLVRIVGETGDWPASAALLGDKARGTADVLVRDGSSKDLEIAFAEYIRGAQCYGWAQSTLPLRSPAKLELCDAMLKAMESAAKIEPQSLTEIRTKDGIGGSAWLVRHEPSALTNRAPLIVIMGGVASWKEIYLSWALDLRKFAYVLIWDPPGFGQTLLQHGLAMEFTRSLSEPLLLILCDYSIKELNYDGLVLLGVSFGGLLAIDIALDDFPGDAIIAIGATDEPYEIFSRRPKFRSHYGELLGVDLPNVEGALDLVVRRASRRQLERPLLMLQGANDKISPSAGGQRLYSRVVGKNPSEYVIVNDAGHSLIERTRERDITITRWIMRALH